VAAVAGHAERLREERQRLLFQRRP
jgi:hypothetical protein